ncbi:hypothetical protein QR685DRAFT_516689 [Neurospora intermedia]|uniref:Secreted protein n=1 Tax=Neurospora intermedia TaxID=5142 RepID=A0ABR3DNI5_NEUIN
MRGLYYLVVFFFSFLLFDIITFNANARFLFCLAISVCMYVSGPLGSNPTARHLARQYLSQLSFLFGPFDTDSRRKYWVTWRNDEMDE